ncbi:unnamed protein product [Choristocarpus tenellus]
MAAIAAAILRGSTTPDHLDGILERGPAIADLHYVDPVGRSLVHIAAGAADVNSLRWLVAHGADPRERSRSGETALHIAVTEGYLDVVVFLLDEVGIRKEAISQETLDAATNSGYQHILEAITHRLSPPLHPPSLDACTWGVSSITPPSVSKEQVCTDAETEGGISHGRDHIKCAPRVVTVSNLCREVASRSSRQRENIDDGQVGSRGGSSALELDSRRVTRGGFFVSGAWSKAGICSCFHIRHRNLLGKHGIVFDMGVCPGEVVHAKHVFISHGHLDHCGAVVMHARLRAKGDTRPPAKYYVPSGIVSSLEKVRQAFEEMNGQNIPMDIVGVSPGSRVDLGQGCFVRPFTVQHRCRSLGSATRPPKNPRSFGQVQSSEIQVLLSVDAM